MQEGQENNNNNENIIIENQVKPEIIDRKLEEKNLQLEHDYKVEPIVITVNQKYKKNNSQHMNEEKIISDTERIEIGAISKEEIIENNNHIESNHNKLELDKEGNTFTLPQEIIKEINLTPCELCKSTEYYIYIPKSFDKNINNENNNNKNNVLFPLLICENEHQYCFLCRQPPHVNEICQKNYMNHNLIKQYFNSLRKQTPQEKINIINSMENYALENSYNPSSSSCCNCGRVCCVISVILLIILYTFVSFAIMAIAILCILGSLAFRILSCLYHCCYGICCISDSYHDEDKGSHISRTIYVNDAARDANFDSCCEIDSLLGNFGCTAAACICSLIPKGYKKICECLD